MKCDYKNCEKEATVKGFVSLRSPDPITGSKFTDVNACDQHKGVSGFFQYTDEVKMEDVL